MKISSQTRRSAGAEARFAKDPLNVRGGASEEAPYTRGDGIASAVSNRAPISANSGLGPVHRSASTDSNSGISDRRVASVRNSSARSRSRASVSDKDARL